MQPPQNNSLLDPQETNVQPPPQTSLVGETDRSDVRFRHAGWGAARERIAQALGSLPNSESRLGRFRDCGSKAWVYQHKSDASKLKVVGCCCRDRWCKPCAAQKSRTIASNLADRLAGRVVRLITLTLRSSDQPLSDQIDRLYRCFTNLRRSRLWRTRVTGGAAFFEVTVSATTGRWHPHLHIVCEGKFLAQKALSRKWEEVTGDSKIVDVRFVRDCRKAAAYVAKYVAKPFPSSIESDLSRLIEAIAASKGRRTCMTFGSWRGWKLSEQKTSDDWQPLIPLGELRLRAECGDPWSIQMLNLLGEQNRRETYDVVGDFGNSGPDPPQKTLF